MNQNLTKLGTQFAAIWKELGIAQRLSVIIATLAVLGGLGGLAMWSSRVDYALLYGRLSESESARVVAALDEAKVPYRISPGSGSVSVPVEKVHLMRMQLAAKGIPKGEGVGFEIFDKPNFGISDFVQRANYVRAVQGELARTIAQLDEIESARVMIVMPENRLLMDKDRHPTASVFVRVRGTGTLPQSAINSIRFLVANAVEGLRSNHVIVVDNMGNVLSENIENDSLVGLTTTQLAARRNLEQYLARKAEGMLERVLGTGQALVRVAAEINYDTVSRTEEKFDPEGQVIRTQTKNEENNDSVSSNPGAVASAAPDADATGAEPTNATPAAIPTTTTKNRKSTGTTEYEINKSTSNIMQGAGGIKRLSAAVTVAARFEGTGADRKMVPRTPEELEKLRRIVQSALGIEQGSGAQRNDEITLEELPFNVETAEQLTQKLDQEERKEFWLGIGQSAVYPAVAVVFLGVLLWLFKRTAEEEIPIGIPIGSLGHGTHGNGHSTAGLPGSGHSRPFTLGRETAPGVISVDVLNRLIKENPDNMTQAIRNWMGREQPEDNR